MTQQQRNKCIPTTTPELFILLPNSFVVHALAVIIVYLIKLLRFNLNLNPQPTIIVNILIVNLQSVLRSHKSHKIYSNGQPRKQTKQQSNIYNIR